MRKKPLPKKQRSYKDDYTTLKYEGTELHLYRTGMLTIKGDTKQAAYALAKHILDDTLNSTFYRCIKINLKKNKPYTIEWLGLGILSDDPLPEPKFWEEFKEEFERYCALKAFS
jgi:hypothetical protein